jgi:hypothetical protein
MFSASRQLEAQPVEGRRKVLAFIDQYVVVLGLKPGATQQVLANVREWIRASALCLLQSKRHAAVFSTGVIVDTLQTPATPGMKNM